MTKTNIDNERDVALWGPSGSGKTWLMNSLARALLYIDDPEFKYALTDITNEEMLRPVSAYQTLDPNPTTRPVDERWWFQRQPKDEKIDSQHLLSSHSHIINLHDLKGLETINLTDPLTRMTILGSEYIILMLDHTLVVKAQQAAVSASAGALGAQTGTYTQNQYAEMVTNLFNALGSKPRHLSICFTKIDMLGVQKRDPWQLIDAYFGAVMTNLLKSYQNEPKWKLEPFCVSAAGYLRGGENKPNYDVQTRGLLYVDQWRPYNVEAPFFWLFEEIERNRLHKSRNGLTRFFFNKRPYIKYPINFS
jgi:GTPase SAR1 family protein